MNNIFFKAKACVFNGIPGYMLRQYFDGKLVDEKFASEVLVSWLQKTYGCLIEIE